MLKFYVTVFFTYQTRFSIYSKKVQACTVVFKVDANASGMNGLQGAQRGQRRGQPSLCRLTTPSSSAKKRREDDFQVVLPLGFLRPPQTAGMEPYYNVQTAAVVPGPFLGTHVLVVQLAASAVPLSTGLAVLEDW